MQKTCSLKIVQCSQTIQGSLDLSKFHSLKILELKRVPPHLLIGLDSLVLQLETLICQRSISSLKEILRSRTKVPQPWLKIRVVNLSYNEIKALDNSLELLPRLQYLDCSNNAISDAHGVEFLHNIRVLNLSFNFLEKIRIQNRGACDALTVLYLRNNRIENTSGLEQLRQLKELDLSYNCLAENSSLAGLKQLYLLAILRLVGNPLTFHKEYFPIVVCHLHHRAATENFRLDDRPLPKKVVKPSNARQPRIRQLEMPAPDPVIFRPSSSRVGAGSGDSSGPPVEEVAKQQMDFATASSSTLNTVEARLSASVEQDGSSCSSFEAAMDTATGRPPRKGRRTKQRPSRVAAIVDQEGYVSPVKQSGTAAAAVALDGEVLDYKIQLECRKEQLGDEWLLGISSLQLPDAQSTPCGTPKLEQPGFPTLAVDKPCDSKDAPSDTDSGRVTPALVTDEDDGPQRKVSELSQGVVVLDEAPPDLLDGEPSALSQLEGFSWTTARSEPSQENAEAAEDLDSKLFLVQTSSNGNETSIFVGVKDDVMRESDSLTGKILQRLDLNVLSSASVHDETTVKLKFDTTIRSKKERCYIFDSSEDAKEVVEMLLPFVEAKARKDLYSELLQCVKCNAEFSKHAVKKVVVSTTDGNVTTVVGADNVSEESIETVIPDQHISLHRPGFRKSASDITILSNPSQSSIMVISTTSTNNEGLENTRGTEKTLSPPPSVVLPTLKEILDEPVLSINRADSLSVCQRSSRSVSETVLSEGSFKSAQSQPNLKEEMEPSSFTCPDHSLLLYLDVKIFGRDEAFVCCVEVDVVAWSSLQEVPALLVVSTTKAYFFKVKEGAEKEDPESWLALWDSRSLESLKAIATLLGNQGFCLSWQPERGTTPWHVCLLRDADRCNCFLQCLTGALQQRVSQPPLVSMDVSESLDQVTSEVVEFYTKENPDDHQDDQEIALFVMGFWNEASGVVSSVPLESVCIVVTSGSIFVSKIHYLKTPKGSTKVGAAQYEPVACQRISNITAVHLCKNSRSARLTFLDEDRGTEMLWTVATKTVASLYTFLNTIRAPWEELFGVEMPLALMAE
ncbi:hypothetical protein HPB48_004371 [Haemaphysalis longicornis]|uniref:Serine/threonine-protein kinase 11-interacting protein n=1 Tax=Haemaphysalis longicornis TaxID=44386 RepID=A0A9J6G2Z8_HAELO|nr:hypothetical protein HPB48_004371 [Haemaphysalis longicornis]